jgi:hypothetical protein
MFPGQKSLSFLTLLLGFFALLSPVQANEKANLAFSIEIPVGMPHAGRHVEFRRVEDWILLNHPKAPNVVQLSSMDSLGSHFFSLDIRTAWNRPEQALEVGKYYRKAIVAIPGWNSVPGNWDSSRPGLSIAYDGAGYCPDRLSEGRFWVDALEVSEEGYLDVLSVRFRQTCLVGGKTISGTALYQRDASENP